MSQFGSVAVGAVMMVAALLASAALGQDSSQHGHSSPPLGHAALDEEPLERGGPALIPMGDGGAGAFPRDVFFIDQFTGSADGLSGTYQFADFSNGVGGNPEGRTWEDQFNPIGNPILSFGLDNHVGVGDAMVMSEAGGSGPLTPGAPWTTATDSPTASGSRRVTSGLSATVRIMVKRFH